jgi:alpha-1,2-mannosidase family protein
MDRLYSAQPDGYCGDEDNGQTSAWYVFSALGFYPVCPGSTQYMIGSPYFHMAKVHLENGKTITIRADKNDKDNRFIQHITMNGQPYPHYYLEHEQLITGPKIDFTMGDKPVK